jgi:hypothetical protein
VNGAQRYVSEPTSVPPLQKSHPTLNRAQPLHQPLHFPLQQPPTSPQSPCHSESSQSSPSHNAPESLHHTSQTHQISSSTPPHYRPPISCAPGTSPFCLRHPTQSLPPQRTVRHARLCILPCWPNGLGAELGLAGFGIERPRVIDGWSSCWSTLPDTVLLCPARLESGLPTTHLIW